MNEIFVSTSCVKTRDIEKSIALLAENGFKNIELSGGTGFRSDLFEVLLRLKTKYRLNYRLHNYFPPPPEPFVINLCDPNAENRERSIVHVKQAIDLSANLGSFVYSIHAGFRINPKSSDLGATLDANRLSDYFLCLASFLEEFKKINDYAERKGVKVFVENNVLTKSNYTKYNNDSPFLLTNHDEYVRYFLANDVPLLLDVAHLKVSAATLGLDFENEFEKLSKLSTYWHVSENDGLSDSNMPINECSEISIQLSKLLNISTTLTLEMYCDVKEIVESYHLISNMYSNNEIL